MIFLLLLFSFNNQHLNWLNLHSNIFISIPPNKFLFLSSILCPDNYIITSFLNYVKLYNYYTFFSFCNLSILISANNLSTLLIVLSHSLINFWAAFKSFLFFSIILFVFFRHTFSPIYPLILIPHNLFQLIFYQIFSYYYLIFFCILYTLPLYINFN